MSMKKESKESKDTREIREDAQASALFKEAFAAEGKALEKEALADLCPVDEERKEAMRRRILEGVHEEKEETGVETATVPRQKRRFGAWVRRAAVILLICGGIIGVTTTSYAGHNSIWSMIRRLIGLETRWEQDNNGEDRTISDPEEYKAIEDIETSLDITLPIFFYWPDKSTFSAYEIPEDASSFVMTYEEEDTVLYCEGWKGDIDTSSIFDWEGNGVVTHETYDGVTYVITEIDNEVYGTCYYVEWSSNDCRFLLSGATDYEELEKILENIKN